MEKKSFLGTGWAFPPTFKKSLRTNEMVSDEVDIFQSLQILFSTQVKERVMRSDYGCDLSPLLYENITTTLKTKIKADIENSILLFEPRINVESVIFKSDDENAGMIYIEIAFKIKATNSRKNFVFPFYLEEGTFINQ